MQPMPAKNRTAVMVGAALLAVIVGAVAVWTSRKPAEQQPTQLEQIGLEPADAAGTAETAPSGATANTGTQPTQASGTKSATEAVTANGVSVPATHTLKEHETLRSVAKQYYGDPIYSADIEELNQIADADNVKAGTELKLPRPEELHKKAQ